MWTSHSPYRPLLDLAQCEYRDLEVMVRQQGLEGTLDALRRAGVYFSFEEFKVGGEVRREGCVFHVTPAQFNNRHAADGMRIRSGGTRGQGTWVTVPLEHQAEMQAPQYAVTMEMLADPDAPIVNWQPGFPAGAGLGGWLSLTRLHRPALRWFSLTPIPRWFHGRRSYWGFRTAHWMAWRAGIPAPMPEFTPVGEVGKVLGAVLDALKAAGQCIVHTTPSCAVRLSAEAGGRGETLRGVQFIVSGEPLTPGKAREIRQAGARVVPLYAMAEIGLAAAPCGDPVEVDDMHLRADALAMVTSPRRIGDMTVDALMFTTLLGTAPKVLLNVEVDDFALVLERRCGCIWDELGCPIHLTGVRSFTKLTGEGTTLLGSNCVHIIERVMPETFGGTSIDYQLVEAEDDARLTRLYLLISPRIGPVDEAAVLRRFTEALEGTDRRPLGGRRPIWEQAQSVRVIRRDPIATGVGKLLPFHTIGASTMKRIAEPVPVRHG